MEFRCGLIGAHVFVVAAIVSIPEAVCHAKQIELDCCVANFSVFSAVVFDHRTPVGSNLLESDSKLGCAICMKLSFGSGNSGNQTWFVGKIPNVQMILGLNRY